MDTEYEIRLLKERNAKVEAEKAWETSSLRKLFVTVITYLFIVLIMSILKIETPLVNALIPTAGFLLSTLTLSFVRTIWLKKKTDVSQP